MTNLKLKYEYVEQITDNHCQRYPQPKSDNQYETHQRKYDNRDRVQCKHTDDSNK